MKGGMTDVHRDTIGWMRESIDIQNIEMNIDRQNIMWIIDTTSIRTTIIDQMNIAHTGNILTADSVVTPLEESQTVTGSRALPTAVKKCLTANGIDRWGENPMPAGEILTRGTEEEAVILVLIPKGLIAGLIVIDKIDPIMK